jgi:hypothetical protein
MLLEHNLEKKTLCCWKILKSEDVVGTYFRKERRLLGNIMIENVVGK